jgi:hypothetical protein
MHVLEVWNEGGSGRKPIRKDNRSDGKSLSVSNQENKKEKDSEPGSGCSTPALGTSGQPKGFDGSRIEPEAHGNIPSANEATG